MTEHRNKCVLFPRGVPFTQSHETGQFIEVRRNALDLIPGGKEIELTVKFRNEPDEDTSR